MINISKILDEAREKIGLEISHYANFHSPSDEDYIPPKVFADQILSISGTTDIECPECKGEKGFVSTSGSLGGTLPNWAECRVCKGEGVIKHKWKIAVVLENGEAPTARKPHFDNYTADEVESFIGIARRDLFRAGYVQEVRQVVEK